MLRINNVTLEGPDLSGKTTLFEAIHSVTNYRWNIQDRSELSMLCYAEMYGRNTDIWHQRLRNRLQNLNDRMIVIIPPLDVILDRYEKRGDDKQTKKSLIELYEIFKKNAKLYSDYSTMGLLEDIEGSVEEITALCITWLADCETSDIDNIAGDIAEIAATSNNEAHPIRFQVDLKSYNSELLKDIMDDEIEGKYYKGIIQNVISNIDKELKGKNDYKIKQLPITSRRFIHTESTCISLFHTMYRKNRLMFYAVCRSSDTIDTFSFDLKFLIYISHFVRDYLDIDIQPEMTLDVTMNSAHIIEG
jgi:thymidylate kinase